MLAEASLCLGIAAEGLSPVAAMKGTGPPPAGGGVCSSCEVSEELWSPKPGEEDRVCCGKATAEA